MGSVCITKNDNDGEANVEVRTSVDECVAKIRRDRISIGTNGPPKWDFDRQLQHPQLSLTNRAADGKNTQVSKSYAYQYNHQLYGKEKNTKVMSPADGFGKAEALVGDPQLKVEENPARFFTEEQPVGEIIISE